jgi:(p)ppGpp synthase/HD superfamily hydrolase
MRLTHRFDEGMLYAHHWHARQTRKGTGIPYISHLLAVAAIALEHGADEDEAIAALLHDSLEDGPRNTGEPQALIAGQIRERFGERVLKIIEGCTEADTSQGEGKESWRQRKERYIQHLETADESVLLVSNADKLHNAQSILRDWEQIGDLVWERFAGQKQGSLWYYGTLAQLFERRRPSALSQELQRVVAKIQE